MSLMPPLALTPMELVARRQNARKSTGPRTVEGKARVRLNSLQHGWRSVRWRRFLLALGIKPHALFRLDRRLRLPGEDSSPIAQKLRRIWLERNEGRRPRSTKGPRRDEQSGEVIENK